MSSFQGEFIRIAEKAYLGHSKVSLYMQGRVSIVLKRGSTVYRNRTEACIALTYISTH